MIETLKLACPYCGAALPSIEVADAATEVVRRTCPNRKCRTRWQVKAALLRRDEVKALHKLEWLSLNAAQES